MDYKNYAETRFQFDPKRRQVWREIAGFVEKWAVPAGCVVELGSGYCDWINSTQAGRRIAIDKFIDPHQYCEKGVEAVKGGFEAIEMMADGSVDIFLASNFFEHLTINECECCFSLIKTKLKKNGRIIIIQPNYRLIYKRYFDDYTHVSIWSDESLCDFIGKAGMETVKVIPAFLPFTMKSRLPKWPFLVRLYLALPFKPFAGQMLIVAKKP